MVIERTISIIKPDAVFKNLVGIIISRFEVSGFMIIGIKMLQLTRDQVKEFYFEHQGKSFFKELVDFMISGPIIVQVLEGENVICRNREIMGATNPKEALSGTIRADYAESYTKNIIHGSDSSQSAIREISYFFNKDEICDRIFLYST